eukprot:41078_1
MAFNQQKSKKVEFHQQRATISTNPYNYCTNTNKHHPTTKFRINRFTHFKPNLHVLEFNRRTSILHRVIGNGCGAMYNVIDITLDEFKARK